MATVKIPPVLRSAVGGEKEIPAAGSNVGEILRAVVAAHPSTEQQIFSGDGQLNRYVNVYLNDEDVRVLEGWRPASAQPTPWSSSPRWPAALTSATGRPTRRRHQPPRVST